MKIVHLLPALEQGGVETVVCDLVRVLVRAGDEVLVVSAGGRLVARVERDGGRHLTLDLKSKNPLTYFFRARRLRRILRDEKPDLVCAHSRVPAWLFVWANRALGLRWITYAHGANSVSRYSEVMTRGNRVVTPSRFLADYLKQHYGTPEEKIRVIPNPVDTARFDPDNLDQAFIAEKRRAWGIAAGERVVMAVGRVTPVKGLDGLIRDFAKRGGREKLVIVGGADKHHLAYLASLKALVASLFPGNPAPPVVFAGPQEKIPECIAIADEIVSANTTKPETFGLSVVEAYAMNKPVTVARRFGGVAEVMAAVEGAGCDSRRAAVLKLYGTDVFAARTLAVYREVLSEAPARAPSATATNLCAP